MSADETAHPAPSASAPQPEARKKPAHKSNAQPVTQGLFNEEYQRHYLLDAQGLVCVPLITRDTTLEERRWAGHCASLRGQEMKRRTEKEKRGSVSAWRRQTETQNSIVKILEMLTEVATTGKAGSEPVKFSERLDAAKTVLERGLGRPHQAAKAAEAHERPAALLSQQKQDKLNEMVPIAMREGESVHGETDDEPEDDADGD